MNKYLISVDIEGITGVVNKEFSKEGVGFIHLRVDTWFVMLTLLYRGFLMKTLMLRLWLETLMVLRQLILS